MLALVGRVERIDAVLSRSSLGEARTIAVLLALRAKGAIVPARVVQRAPSAAPVVDASMAEEVDLEPSRSATSSRWSARWTGWTTTRCWACPGAPAPGGEAGVLQRSPAASTRTATSARTWAASAPGWSASSSASPTPTTPSAARSRRAPAAPPAARTARRLRPQRPRGRTVRQWLRGGDARAPFGARPRGPRPPRRRLPPRPRTTRVRRPPRRAPGPPRAPPVHGAAATSSRSSSPGAGRPPRAGTSSGPTRTSTTCWAWTRRTARSRQLLVEARRKHDPRARRRRWSAARSWR